MGSWSIAGDSWREGRHNGTVVTDAGLGLIQGVSRGVWEGVAAVEGDRFVASLNPDPFPPGAGIRLSVHVGGAWVPLLLLGAGPDLPRGSTAEGSGWAVEGDLLRLAAPRAELRLRLEVEAGDLGGRPRLRRLVVAGWRAGATPPREPDHPAAWGTELAVAGRSQRTEPGDLPGRGCSPTALAMVLAFHGHELATPDLAERVRDREQGIYGNWSLNVAAAAELGLEAEVVRLAGLGALEREVAAGRPVVISHRYSAGQLSGTPLSETAGHLLVVAGFTAEGDVIVRDPAADPRQGEAVRRVYARSEVERTWLTNEPTGIAYLVRPSPPPHTDPPAGSS